MSRASDDSVVKTDHVVRIKLSGDGTNIGKRLSVESFTYTIVDADDLGYNGNHYFAIFKGPEKYEVLQTALSDLVSETTRLKSIDVDGVTYKLVFYLGGDLKFLNVVSGLDSCCCRPTYCVFCKCPKQEFYDVTKTWSVSDQVYGAGTIEKNEANSKLKKKQQAYNCAHAPLFKIPVAKTVPDVLHLFLRILSQGLEKLNEKTTSWFFRSSNHRPSEAFRQVMLKKIG